MLKMAHLKLSLCSGLPKLTNQPTNTRYTNGVLATIFRSCLPYTSYYNSPNVVMCVFVV